MDADERAIYYYLKSRRPNFARLREISRHVGGRRRFRLAPEWATPVLIRMIERGLLETDDGGHYRLRPMPPQETEGKRWVSPQIIEILKAKGTPLGDLVIPEDEDAYYDKL